MALFALPAHSKVRQGLAWPAPPDSTRVKRFQIHRWNPDEGGNPRLDTFTIDLDRCGPMVPDSLFKIKNEIDPTLAFRRSCREGICGSCSMCIDGENRLACLTPIEDVSGDVRVYPLPHMAVVKGLVVDLDPLCAQHRSIKPWL